MKRLNSFSMIVFCLSLLLLINSAQATPDKFGNGGSVWACETQTGEITDLMLIDIDEARRQDKLTVPETSVNHIPYLQDKKDWIRNNLSIQFVLIPHIEYVEQNLNLIDGEMTLVPDIKNISKPSPVLCKGGRWTAKTVVNFGDDGRVLGSKELFNSPFLTEMERTALYLHEGIYSYMRTEFGDQDSVRSRRIVGYIMSNLPDAEKVKEINKILANAPPVPPTSPGVGGYICGLKPDRYKPLYTADKKTEDEARKAVIEECVSGEKLPLPFPFDFPKVPGFPGDGGGFGPDRECRPAKVLCESYDSSQKKVKCSIRGDFSDSPEKYTGAGRTLLEAQKDVINRCVASGDSDFTCYDAGKLSCK